MVFSRMVPAGVNDPPWIGTITDGNGKDNGEVDHQKDIWPFVSKVIGLY